MRHHQQDAFKLGKRLLKPHTCLQIQVIGRLIQNQKRGVHKQSTRERDTHAPPTRKVLGCLGLHLLVKPQPVQNGRRTCLCGVAVERIQSLVNVLQALLHLGTLQPHQCIGLGFQSCLFFVHTHHGLQGRHVRGLNLTIQVVDVDVLGEVELPEAQRTQQGRLSAAIGADEAIAAAIVELDLCVGQEFVAVVEHRDGFQVDVARLRVACQDAGGGNVSGPVGVFWVYRQAGQVDAAAIGDGFQITGTAVCLAAALFGERLLLLGVRWHDDDLLVVVDDVGFACDACLYTLLGSYKALLRFVEAVSARQVMTTTGDASKQRAWPTL